MAQCISPFGVRDKLTKDTIPVPCGKCPACVARRTSAWSFRLMQEEKISSSAHFITLTYNTTHVPLTRNGFMTLHKKDVQDFMKRLRWAHPDGVKLKYFAVGEYGGKTNRPHYHLILYNADITLIQAAWDKGQVHYGTVSGASIGYCLKYMAKRGKIPMHRNDDRLPEFPLMSKGLGASYCSDAMLKWHHDKLDERMFCNLPDGRKVSMPRYYKDRIYNEVQRKRVAFFTRLRMVEANELAESEGGQHYFRDLSELHLQQFSVMWKSHSQGQKL